MGIIKPPWITYQWFRTCPFNYCDHFGDKEALATVCIICKEDIERIEKYTNEGKNLYAIENVFADVANNLVETMALVQEDAREMGIDLNNIPDEYEEPIPYEDEPIYQIALKYGDSIDKVIRDFEVVPIETDSKLLEYTLDALSHSRSYVRSKIGRALRSRWEEATDPIFAEVADSKTSALFAYMAVERNARALKAVANHKPLIDFRLKTLRTAKTSLKIAQLIKNEFFPYEDLDCKEFGCDSFNTVIQKYL